MQQEDPLLSTSSPGEVRTGTDAPLVERMRAGDAAAGSLFVRDYYPGIYRYLLYLTGRREAAEDLTQETFLQAWRRLETFDHRGLLRPWLHRIAHREFLQALRSQRRAPGCPPLGGERGLDSLEEIAEIPAPGTAGWTEAVELRTILGKLPVEQREAVVLHYLEGYSSEEIARIVGAPAGTVRYRLSEARALLRRELGEGDLAYLNQAPGAVLRRWSWLPLEALTALEARLSLVNTGWLTADAAEASPKGEDEMSDKTPGGMSRRKLLEAAGSAAAAVAAASLTGPAGAATSQNESEVVDDRLGKKVTLAVKAMALADLCEQLRSETGIPITAGPSVADEKVTLFCEKLPLREVMRQLSRPFGYTWLRTKEALGVRRQALGESPVDPNAQRLTPNAQYGYELVQELRSQLLEEELRNRDRNAAFVALEQEIQRYHPYLDLSPDDALARAKTAPAEEKPLLETIGRSGWGAIQMYFRLTPQQLAALRAGEALRFSQVPNYGEQPLPSDVAHGVLQSLRDVFYHKHADGFGLSTGVTEPKEGDLPPTAVPEARATINLSIRPTELGRIALQYSAGTFSQSDLPRNSGGGTTEGDGSLAVGASPAAIKPDNRAANARLAREPALHRRISVQPQPDLTPRPFPAREGESPGLAGDSGAEDHRPPSPSRGGAGGGVGPEPKVTTADALEALHHATGLPIVSDFYTHLYSPGALAVHDQPLFDALNRLADSMRLRWSRDGDWLQFRSAGYYDDRLKEVPNRLLTRWATARRQHGSLTLDDLCEIVQLSDAQLDADAMAEGARACWDLAEWHLAASRGSRLRRHLRFLAELTPAQRQEAMSPAGLAFTRMSLPQQQRYIALALRFDEEPLQSLDELSGAMMRVVYTQPGGFEWLPPGPNWYQWVVPVVPGEGGTRAVISPVVARTREAALAAARRIDAHLLEAILPEARRLYPHCQTASDVPVAGEIKPTDLDLTIVYVPGLSSKRNISLVSTHADFHNSSW